MGVRVSQEILLQVQLLHYVYIILVNVFVGNSMKVSITYKDKTKDKVKVSVTYDDLWNGDVTLARVIYPFLKKYRKRYDKHKGYQGYPMDFAPDPTKPEGPDNLDRFDEWLQCLDKMVYSFEWIAKNRGWDGPSEKEYYKECSKLGRVHKKELKKLKQEDKERFKNIKGPAALESLEWNRYSELMRPSLEIFSKKFEEHRQKLQEGIELFAKYFGSFWL